MRSWNIDLILFYLSNVIFETYNIINISTKLAFSRNIIAIPIQILYKLSVGFVQISMRGILKKRFYLECGINRASYNVINIIYPFFSICKHELKSITYLKRMKGFVKPGKTVQIKYTSTICFNYSKYIDTAPDKRLL